MNKMMKNFVLFLSLLLVTSCGPTSNPTSTPTTNPTIDPTVDLTTNSNVEPTAEPTTEPFIPTTDEEILDAFNHMYEASLPTRITSFGTYLNLDFNIELDTEYILTVEYADVVKSRLDYSFEKMNDLSADKLISEHTGTIYTYDDKVYGDTGEIEDASVQLYLSPVSFDDAYVESMKLSEDRKTLTFEIKDERVRYFFGKSRNISDLKLVFTINDFTSITALKTTYFTSTDASVEIDYSFDYKYYKVTVPTL